MRVDQQFRPFLRHVRAGALAAFVFVSGMPLSAFGQAPQSRRHRPTPPPGAPARPDRGPNPAVVNGTPLTMDEAVRMALENNLGIQRGTPEPGDPELRRRRAPSARSRPPCSRSVTRGNARRRRPIFCPPVAASVVTADQLHDQAPACSRCCRSAGPTISSRSTGRARRPTRRRRSSARSSDRI